LALIKRAPEIPRASRAWDREQLIRIAACVGLGEDRTVFAQQATKARDARDGSVWLFRGADYRIGGRIDLGNDAPAGWNVMPKWNVADPKLERILAQCR
jgi:hypothetical protein